MNSKLNAVKTVKTERVSWEVALSFGAIFQTITYRLIHAKIILIAVGAMVALNSATIAADMLSNGDWSITGFLYSLLFMTLFSVMALTTFLLIMFSVLSWQRARRNRGVVQKYRISSVELTISSDGVSSSIDRKLVGALFTHKRGFTTKIEGVGRVLLLCAKSDQAKVSDGLVKLGWL